MQPSAARAVPLGLFALAAAVRCLPFPTVFEGGRVVFIGHDAYYHMRRVLDGLERFPALLSFDPFINFPDGARSIWPPLFDRLVVALALPFHALGGEPWAEGAAALAPPLLGALTVVGLHLLALRWFGSATAALAGLGLALLSGHYWYSRIGFVDHHVAVALASLGVLAAGMSLLAALADPAERAVRGSVVGAGLARALALALWPGCLLFVGILDAALLLHLVTRQTRDAACRSAAALAGVHGVALVALAPFVLDVSWPQWGDYSPAVLSRFQPWLLASQGGLAAGCWALWRGGMGATRAARFGQTLALGGAVLAASVALLPGLVEGARDAWEWLAKEESFQASVAESRPLFVAQGRFSVALAELRLSRFVYALPILVGALAWRERGRADREAIWLLAAWAAALAAVTLVQKRFFNSLSVPFALLVAWGVVALHRRLAARLPAGPARLAGGAALAAACLWLAAPSFETYREPLANLARARRGEPTRMTPAARDLRRAVEVAEWMRRNTPEPARPGERAAWGVLAPSGIGHVLEHVARRPTVTNNFGDDIGRENYEAARRYLASRDEAEAEAIADALAARYVVASVPTVVGGRTPPNPPIHRRLARYDGRGLAGYRLVYEGSPPERQATPYKVFERVPGARITGRAAPGAAVVAEIALRTERGRPLTWSGVAVADAKGTWVLRVPYASRGEGAFVLAEGAYRLEAGSCSGRVQVDESAVREASVVRGPDLCCEAMACPARDVEGEVR